MINLKENKGFTMIEMIITIAVLSAGIIGSYNAFYSIMNLADTMSYRLTAAYLGQEGLEIIRNIRDNNFIDTVSWSSGLTLCGGGCQADYKTGTTTESAQNQLQAYSSSNFLKINSDGFYSYDLGSDTKFKRRITITNVSADTLEVLSEVFWNYNGTDYSTSTKEYLYDWY